MSEPNFMAIHLKAVDIFCTKSHGFEEEKPGKKWLCFILTHIQQTKCLHKMQNVLLVVQQKSRGCPKPVGIIPWGPLMFAQDVMAIYPTAVKTFQQKIVKYKKKKWIIRVTKIYPLGTMNIPSQFHGNLSNSCSHILHIIPCLAEEGSGKKWLCIILKDIQQWMSVINEFQLLGWMLRYFRGIEKLPASSA